MQIESSLPCNKCGGLISPRLILLVLLLLCMGEVRSESNFAGRELLEVLLELQGEGAPLLFSSNLVHPGLIVESEPTSSDPVVMASELLTPFGLALKFQDGVYVVVRDESRTAVENPGPSPDTPGQATRDSTELADLEIVTVSASRYILQSASQFLIDQAAIQALPDLGEDPLRSVHRLPGVAANGLSAKSHFRGGELNEMAIYLNGLKLLEPFHIRDYHSIFSSIDARAISGIEAYTGGFPAQFGDHMSGVLSLQSSPPEKSRQTALGISFYNTSVLHSGFSEKQDWDWLISLRDSNLDLILDPGLGSPDYFDVYAQLGHQLSDRTSISFNALYANDSVVVITEDDPAELERSESETDNQQIWIQMQTDWLPDLGSSTVLSLSSFDNLRVAEVNDPEQMTSRVRDQRKVTIWGLTHSWKWTGWERHDIRWGLEYFKEKAEYQYSGFAEYDGFLAELPGLENPRIHQVDSSPSGYGASLFLADRLSLTDTTWLELGLRWDRQTWTTPDFDDQLSPRVSLLHKIDSQSDIRVSWGRYYQSQGIEQLQVEDGVDQFFRPQRADHYIVGYHRNFPGDLVFRTEAFVKRYSRLKPRFENFFDPLALIPEMAPDRTLLIPDSAESRGLEFSLQRHSEEGIDWWVSYVLSRATDEFDGVSQPRSWDQRHALQAGLSWRNENWEIGMAVSAHSGWPTTSLDFTSEPDGDDLIPLPGTRNNDRYSTFFTFDFRISRDFDVKKGRLSAFLEISNATNRKNPCCTDFDIDDELDPPQLDKTLDYWVPIIPAIGLVWEF